MTTDGSQAPAPSTPGPDTLGCPACAPIRAALAPGESVRCTVCDGPEASPRPTGPSRRQPRPTGDLERDLALVLADLDVLERWLARAGYGCSLRDLQGASGVGAGLDYLDGGTALLRRWDPEDAACRALLWRALEAAAEGLPGPERTRDPDWTRARELERRLRAVQGEPARTLWWLAGRAVNGDALGALAERVGWELATLAERERWVAAGVAGVQEAVRRRAGRPRRQVQRAMVAGPREAGLGRLREAVAAWWER